MGCVGIAVVGLYVGMIRNGNIKLVESDTMASISRAKVPIRVALPQSLLTSSGDMSGVNLGLT